MWNSVYFENEITKAIWLLRDAKRVVKFRWNVPSSRINLLIKVCAVRMLFMWMMWWKKRYKSIRFCSFYFIRFIFPKLCSERDVYIFVISNDWNDSQEAEGSSSISTKEKALEMPWSIFSKFGIRKMKEVVMQREISVSSIKCHTTNKYYRLINTANAFSIWTQKFSHILLWFVLMTMQLFCTFNCRFHHTRVSIYKIKSFVSLETNKFQFSISRHWCSIKSTSLCHQKTLLIWILFVYFWFKRFGWSYSLELCSFWLNRSLSGMHLSFVIRLTY